MGDFEKVGVEAVVQGSDAFDRALDRINTRVSQTTQALQASQKELGTQSQASLTASSSTNTLTQATQGLTSAQTAVTASLGSTSSAAGAITAALLGVAAVIGVVVAATITLIHTLTELASRSSSIDGVAESFGRMAVVAGTTGTDLFERLRTASRGLVSDFDLLKKANLALSGVSGELAKRFGQDLPRLLQLAQLQARATGQDVTYLFNSLVMGVKRASPMLIDNTGIVLKVGEANRKYAEELGKSVEELTAQEKAIAVLNATLAAGDIQMQILGGTAETLSEKMQRAEISIQNTLDILGSTLQEPFKEIQDTINTVLLTIEGLVRAAAPYLIALGRLVAQVIKTYIFGPIDRFQETINSAEAAKAFFTGAANTFGAFLRGIYEAKAMILEAVASIAQGIADLIVGLSPPKKGPLKDIDKGGTRIMEAWLEGLLGVSLEPVNQVIGYIETALGAIGKWSLPQVNARIKELDAALQPYADKLAVIRSNLEAIQEPAEAAFRAIERQLERTIPALLAGIEGSDVLVRALDARRSMIEQVVDAQQEAVDNAQIQFTIAQGLQIQERTLLAIRKRQLGPAKTLAAVAEKEKKAKKEAAGKQPKEEKLPAGEPPIPEVPTELPDLGGMEPFTFTETTEADIAAAGEAMNAAFKEGLAGADVKAMAAQGKLDAALYKIKGGLMGVGDDLVTSLNSMFEGLELGTKLKEKIDEIWPAIAPAIDGLIGPMNPLSMPFKFLEAAGLIVGTIETLKTDLIAKVSEINPALGPIIDAMTSVTDPLSMPFKWIAAGEAILQEISNWSTTWPVEFDRISASITTWLNQIADPLNPNSIPARFEWVKTRIGTTVSEIGTDLSSKLTTAWNSISTTLSAWFDIGSPTSIFGRINEFVGNVNRKWSELQNAFTGWMDGVGIELSATVSNWFDIGSPTSIFGRINEFIQTVEGKWSEIQTAFTGWTTDVTTRLSEALLSWFGPTTPGSIVYEFVQLPTRLLNALATIGPTLQDNLIQPIWDKITGLINFLFGEDWIGGFFYNWVNLPTFIITHLQAFVTSLQDELITPVIDRVTAFIGNLQAWFTGTEEGQLGWIIQEVINFFKSIPNRIQLALKTMGKVLWESFVRPIITAINSVLQGFEDLINSLLPGLISFMETLEPFMALTPSGALFSAALSAIKGSKGLDIQPLSVDAPDWVGGASGGIFSKGFLRVGERGQELIANASRKLAVFPNQVVRQLDTLASLSSHVVSSPIASQTSYDYSRTQTNTFNGVPSPEKIARRLAMLRAF